MKRFVPSLLFATLGGCVALPLSFAVSAQEVDETGVLPDAKPGECFAKVITPATFATRTEEVVVQEATVRFEARPAEYEGTEEKIETKQASTIIETRPATFEDVVEEVQVRPRELLWMTGPDGGQGRDALPASPDMLAGIARAGVELDAADPGTCFIEHYVDLRYRTELERVLTREASTRIEIEPAMFETVEKRVKVKDASTRFVNVPAVFRTESESVRVEPARSVWKPGRGPIEKIDGTTGEILCLVEIPARYEDVIRTVLDTPAATRTVNVPAEFETVEVRRLISPASERRIEVPAEYVTVETRRKVADARFFWARADSSDADADADAVPTGRQVCRVERPAGFRSVPRQVVVEEAMTVVETVPAEYRTIPVRRIATPAREVKVEVPRRTETVERRDQTAPSKLEWRRVLCETNMTPGVVSSLQRALIERGFEPGAPDGVIGQATMQAVEAFQEKESLDRGGLTYETLQALNVER